MFRFMNRYRTQAQDAPPAVLPPSNPRAEWSTEVYRRTVYTPQVEYIPVPGVTVANPSLDWTGESAGQLVTIKDPSTGILETVLVLDGVSK